MNDNSKNVEIPYRSLVFHLNLQKPLQFNNFPTFVFRGLLGKELKKLTCLFSRQACEDCSLLKSCGYSVIFETPINKDNSFLHGRNYASHPFVLYVPHDFGATVEPIKTVQLHITVFGRAIEYFPYIYFAIKRGGESGIFRERVSFSISDVTADGESVLTELTKDHDLIDIEQGKKLWKLSLEETSSNSTTFVEVDITSPLRLKVKGNYTDTFTAYDLLLNAWRRVFLISTMYGTPVKEKNYKPPEQIQFSENLIKWIDLERWSGRQKNKMKMGGVVGRIVMEGPISEKELALLRFGEIFHLGKNTGFGLGKIKINE